VNTEQARKIARFHLDVAHALYRSREQLGLSVETVAERAGLTPDRIIVIEEGDTTSLTEVALFCDALGVAVSDVLPEPSGQMRRGERQEISEARILRTG
jgi:transcriptional regulator with XRE-family HTH domain